MAPKADKPKAAAKTAVEKPVKKTKKAKDPNAPKRPLSAYFFFSTEIREKVKTENPSLTFGEIGKAIGERWSKLTDAEKGPYEQKAVADKERYEKEKAAYEKTSSK